MKELFLDEGIEDRVLDDLRHVGSMHNFATLCVRKEVVYLFICCAALGVKGVAVQSNR